LGGAPTPGAGRGAGGAGLLRDRPSWVSTPSGTSSVAGTVMQAFTEPLQLATEIFGPGIALPPGDGYWTDSLAPPAGLGGCAHMAYKFQNVIMIFQRKAPVPAASGPDAFRGIRSQAASLSCRRPAEATAPTPRGDLLDLICSSAAVVGTSPFALGSLGRDRGHRSYWGCVCGCRFDHRRSSERPGNGGRMDAHPQSSCFANCSPRARFPGAGNQVPQKVRSTRSSGAGGTA
jgi:hypothetical protein